MATAIGGRKGSASAEELAVDVTRLMDAVREEVTTILLEGVQKSASFCASLCVQRIVEARREFLLQKQTEERRELERHSSTAVVPCKPSERDRQPVAAVAPCRQLSAPSPCSNATASPWSHATTVMPAGLAASLCSPRGCIVPLSPQRCPRPSPGLVASQERIMQPTASPTPTSPAAAAVAAQQLSPASAAHSASPKHKDDQSCESVILDACVAVQTLEVRTQMAAQAMDLLDEALRTATGYGGPPASVGSGSPKEEPGSPLLPASGGAGEGAASHADEEGGRGGALASAEVANEGAVTARGVGGESARETEAVRGGGGGGEAAGQPAEDSPVTATTAAARPADVPQAARVVQPTSAVVSGRPPLPTTAAQKPAEPRAVGEEGGRDMPPQGSGGEAAPKEQEAVRRGSEAGSACSPVAPSEDGWHTAGPSPTISPSPMDSGDEFASADAVSAPQLTVGDLSPLESFAKASEPQAAACSAGDCAAQRRIACPEGTRCRRRDTAHLSAQAHPFDADYAQACHACGLEPEELSLRGLFTWVDLFSTGRASRAELDTALRLLAQLRAQTGHSPAKELAGAAAAPASASAAGGGERRPAREDPPSDLRFTDEVWEGLDVAERGSLTFAEFASWAEPRLGLPLEAAPGTSVDTPSVAPACGDAAGCARDGGSGCRLESAAA